MKKITGLLVLCLFMSHIAVCQRTTIRGLVYNEAEKPLEGATVEVLPSGNSTVTDANGAFSIAVAPGGQLRVSFVGYKTQVTAITDSIFYKIVLPSGGPEQLETVVVTALGLKRQQRELGYATQEVKGNTLQTVKGVDVATSLTGKVSGLMVKNSAEFAAEPEMTIRGEKPILVIDGIPYANMTLRDVPADDIESINFLKGATAAALYGARGGSGAVMVTTKRGVGKKG